MNKKIKNFQVSITEAILFFLITVIVGQLVSAIFMIPISFIPDSEAIFYPLGFAMGFGSVAVIIMLYKSVKLKDISNSIKISPNILTFIISLGLYFAGLPIAEFLSTLVPTTGHSMLERAYEVFMDSFEEIFKMPVTAFIMVCILAPILEELIFRGLILKGMLNTKVNPWIAILLTSFLFGLAHLNPWQFMGAGFIGLILGFVYWRTKSLWLCIFLHFANNFIAFMIVLNTQDMEETVFNADYTTLGFSIILTVLIGFLLINKTKTIK